MTDIDTISTPSTGDIPYQRQDDYQTPNRTFKNDRDYSSAKAASKSAGRSLSSSGQSMMDQSRDDAASRVGAVSYKRGGKVRKTGPALLHKGELRVKGKMAKRGKLRAANSR